MGSRIAVREEGRVFQVAAGRLREAAGGAALARLRSRGHLTLLLFDDEWHVLTRGRA